MIDGHVFGKSAKVTAATETRAILPLPSALLIIDVALARRWNQWINQAVSQDHGVHIGARLGTQAWEISHALQLVIEGGLDTANGSAIGQSDIKSYFDSLPIMKIALWLVEHGAPPEDVAAKIRFLMRLHVGDGASFALHGRTIGGLTGTRAALVLARIPVETMAAAVHAQCSPFAPGAVFCVGDFH